MQALALMPYIGNTIPTNQNSVISVSSVADI